MMRLPLLLLVAIVASARAENAARWLFAPIDGQLAGDIALKTILPGAPALRWTLVAMRRNEHTQHAVLTLAGPGTQVRLEADLDAAKQTGTWKLTDASFDLAQWNAVLVHSLPAPFAGLIFTGTVQTTGSGVIQNSGPAGEIRMTVRDATVRDPEAGWRLDGVGAEGRFAVDTGARRVQSAAPMTLTVRTITTKRFGARNLTVDGTLEDKSKFALSSARIEIAGGDVSAAPCSVELSPFRITVDLTIDRIGLQDVAALVPNALANARGRVDGVARISWSEATGFQVGNGHLILRKDGPADVTLRPFPGLFTARLNSAVQWLLPGLRKAELGEVPIEADSLEVTFSPTPDAEGRTAVIHLTGTPKDKRRTPIDLETNVHGPLQTFLDLGTTKNLRVGVGVH